MKPSKNIFTLNLIESSKKGRKSSFIELTKMNLVDIYVMALRILIEPDLAENATFKTFIYAWGKIKSVNVKITFGQWLKRIAIIIILNDIKENSDKLESERISPELLGKYFNIQNISEPNTVIEILVALPMWDRIIFTLHDIYNFSYEEISKLITHLTLEEIKNIIQNIRGKIIKALSQ